VPEKGACWRCKTVLKFTASLQVTWCLFHQGGSSLDLWIQGSEANHYGWMWRPAEVEAINRQAPRAKGGVEPGSEWAGPVGPGRSAQAHFGLVRPRFPPRLLLAWFLICVHLHVGLWRRSSRLRLESLQCKLCCFLVESLKTCMLMLRSSCHLESCSSCVLTLVGLHDLLPKCLVNLSWKSPLSVDLLRKQWTPKSTCKSELVIYGGLVPVVRIINQYQY
jgi:hypothetical protein